MFKKKMYVVWIFFFMIDNIFRNGAIAFKTWYFFAIFYSVQTRSDHPELLKYYKKG